MGKLISQFPKFGVVGVIATGIDFGVMILLTELLGVGPVASSAASFAVSLVFNYLASMRYVFTHREDLSRRREFAIFVVLSLVGLGLNTLTMWAGTAWLGDSWYVLVKAFATGVVMLWNFVSRKVWLDGEQGALAPRMRRAKSFRQGYSSRVATLYGVTLGGILFSCIFLSHVRYACSSEMLPSALLVLPGLMLILGIYLTICCLQNCLPIAKGQHHSHDDAGVWPSGLASVRSLWFVLIVFALILFVFQCVCISEYYFQSGWDVQGIAGLSDAIASGDEVARFNEYFSVYPNNLFLAWCQSLVKRLAIMLGMPECGPLWILWLQALGCSATGLVTAGLVWELLHDSRLTVFAFVLFHLLAGMSPWIAIPYSDAASFFIPALSALLYVRQKATDSFFLGSWAIMGFLASIGYAIKPQTTFIFMAIVIVELISADKGRVVALAKEAAAAVAGIALAILLTSSAVSSIGLTLDKDMSLGVPHFLMMGLNPERMGIYAQQDVNFSRSFVDPFERTQANLRVAGDRLSALGPVGTMQLFVRKTLTNYNDGTFAWGVEGSFFTEVFPSDGTPLAKLMRGIYYTGEYSDQGLFYEVWANFEQAIWLAVLVLGALAALELRRRPSVGTLAIMLSIMGLTLFETIFEARARYLFTYAPLYITMAACGMRYLQNILLQIKAPLPDCPADDERRSSESELG